MSVREKVLHGLTRSDSVRAMYSSSLRVPGLGPAVRSVVHKLLPRGIKLWIEIPSGLARGLWMRVDPRFEPGYLNGDYEPWLQELLRAHLKPGDCFYDVGAHTGFFSMLAARLVSEAGHVVAVEADPENAGALRGNVSRNEMRQIQLVEAAVWSEEGELVFAQASSDSNRTQGHVSATEPSSAGTVRVRACTLDTLVFDSQLRRPNLVKMDVEGAEWEAFQGARRTFEEAKPKLLCEIHDPARMGDFDVFLAGFGYATERLAPVHPHYSDYRQEYLWAVARG